MFFSRNAQALYFILGRPAFKPHRFSANLSPFEERWEPLHQHVVQSTPFLPASPAPVDHVLEAVVDDFRMLADDILKICWSPCLLHVHDHTECELSILTVGPSPCPPFVSNSSVGINTSLVLPNDDLQLPVLTLLITRNVSQVLALHETILRYASRMHHIPLTNIWSMQPS